MFPRNRFILQIPNNPFQKLIKSRVRARKSPTPYPLPKIVLLVLALGWNLKCELRDFQLKVLRQRIILGLNFFWKV